MEVYITHLLPAIGITIILLLNMKIYKRQAIRVQERKREIKNDE